MKSRCSILMALAAAMTLGTCPVRAATPGDDRQVSAEHDPMAPVYIVTSHDTYLGVQGLVRNGVARRDSLGTPLVVSELPAHRLAEINRYVHQRELRCGGYFAFASRAQADAFVRSDRAAQALARPLLVSYTIDNQATVNPWLPQVQESRIYDAINHLSSYRNRYYASTTGKSSAEWIRDSWQALAAGRSDASTELFTACSNCSTQPSVILTVQGTELADEIVVLGAHLDSINSNGGGSTTQLAPGADDDASGIATLTEVIRVAMASGWRPRRTVKFMGYAAEEVGLRGSNAIAQSFRSGNRNVVGVLQLDMTNYKSGAVEDMQLVSDYSNADLKTFLTQLFDTYLAPLGLSRGTYTCGYGCSDHASWTSAGYPSAMMFEAGDSGGYFPHIHTANDTLANMGESAEHSVKFAKLGLAFLGELAKTTGGTPGNTAPVANFSVTRNGLTANFTDASTDSDGTIASRSWNFGDGTAASTATHPSHTYAAAGTYTVVLTVTDNGGASHTASQAVTVTAAPGDNVLSNGVPKTGIAGAAGSEQFWMLPIPTDGAISNLKFVTNGGSGDVDLYVKYGAPPTTTSYDCKSEGSSNAETCNMASAQAGTYYVMLRGYSAFSGVSLTGSFTAGDGIRTYSNTADYTINDNATIDSPIIVSGRSGNVQTPASIAVAIVHTYSGDLKVDLVAPDGTLYNLHNRTGGSTDNINKTVTLNLSSEALNGTWKLRANDNAAQDTGRIDSWSITF
ncbi:M20/M25/M40 family metallo-hydrolase [Lysobacter cavernae]|uniref:M20/M25/M40 family metallo-hydrolase n=1 Tax=Lysobacter cavernae TaxID=1685901 RepID=A0ABV7RTG6_9GAMM